MRKKYHRHKHNYIDVALYHHWEVPQFSKCYDWVARARVCEVCGKIEKVHNLIFNKFQLSSEKGREIWDSYPKYYINNFGDKYAKVLSENKS